MIELTGLDGSAIFIAPKSIFRIRPPAAVLGQDTTKVDHSTGYLFTREAAEALIERLGPGISMIKLTTRSSLPVYLNAGAIASIREALPINAPGTEIVINGKYQHVMESVDEVRALLS
jgi:uncharacterized protein YlzI (FlbEa/FlbD family)